MYKISEIRKESFEHARKLEEEYRNLDDKEKYAGIEFRKEETTVSDIVKLVREGQPINGIQRVFGADDDEDGTDDERSDDDERSIHDKAMEGKEYYDDDLMLLNRLSEKERQKYYEEHPKPEPKPEPEPEPEPKPEPEPQPE